MCKVNSALAPLFHARTQRGGWGVRTPLENSQSHHYEGSLSNTGPDSVENHKASKPAFNVELHRPASETLFKWRFAGGPMMARFKCCLDPLSSAISTKKEEEVKKQLSELDPL